MKLFKLLTALTAAVIWVSASASGTESPGDNRVPAAADLMETLWETMNSIATLRADFTETKTLSFLTEPLESSGIMVYRRPDLLVRYIQSPSRQLIWISGNRLITRHLDLGTDEEIDLERQPEAARIVQQFLWLFQGNRAEIRRQYTLAVERAGQEIHVTLTPVTEPMVRIARDMRFEFQSDFTPLRFIMTDLGGDQSVLTFRKMAVNESIDTLLREIAPDLVTE